jgi:hypothetical protein
MTNASNLLQHKGEDSYVRKDTWQGFVNINILWWSWVKYISHQNRYNRCRQKTARLDRPRYITFHSGHFLLSEDTWDLFSILSFYCKFIFDCYWLQGCPQPRNGKKVDLHFMLLGSFRDNVDIHTHVFRDKGFYCLFSLFTKPENSV